MSHQPRSHHHQGLRLPLRSPHLLRSLRPWPRKQRLPPRSLRLRSQRQLRLRNPRRRRHCRRMLSRWLTVPRRSGRDDNPRERSQCHLPQVLKPVLRQILKIHHQRPPLQREDLVCHHLGQSPRSQALKRLVRSQHLWKMMRSVPKRSLSRRLWIPAMSAWSSARQERRSSLSRSSRVHQSRLTRICRTACPALSSIAEQKSRWPQQRNLSSNSFNVQRRTRRPKLRLRPLLQAWAF
mmetsp:Transcript_161007/g.285453  ORF Transcript_161007/g.285453 Transcript_161007/m.285453 type:complete len:237 (-) Transcript_161007:1108-1818(-)